MNHLELLKKKMSMHKNKLFKHLELNSLIKKNNIMIVKKLL